MGGSIASELRELAFAGRLVKAWGTKRRSGPDVFFIVHNRNHVQIFDTTARLLEREGFKTAFVSIEYHPAAESAQAALRGSGREWVSLIDMVRRCRRGSIICVGNDWGPRRLKLAMRACRQLGAKLLAVVEGAGFGLPGRYQMVDEVLCWGPSGADLLDRPAVIVGAPMLEKVLGAAQSKQGDAAHRVLINYKFNNGVFDTNGVWGAAAIAAAQAIDPEYELSVHPNTKSWPDGARKSNRTFAEALQDARLLITRPSTVIYEALAAGVSVITHPLPGEPLGEFADHCDAFSITSSIEELALVAQTQTDFRADAAAAFLDRHISIDPDISASQRIANALSRRVEA